MERSELQKGTVLRFSDTQAFEILQTIGGGGSSLLYEARELGSQLHVAIKELYPAGAFVRTEGEIVPLALSGGLGKMKETLETRVSYLSQKASRRNHQVLFSLPPVWHSAEICLPDGTVYKDVRNTYVRMESLREKGESLTEYIRRGRENKSLTLADAMAVMETVLNAYAVLHEDGFIHGDCQKGNLFLLRAGEKEPGIACIIDFDSARELLEDGRSAPVTEDIYATDGYCAPEILLRSGDFRMSAASDVWSLGYLFLELLTDRGMEEQERATEYLVIHPKERRLSRWEAQKLDCSPAQAGLVNAILEKAMAVDPEGRYRDAGEMRKDLLALRRCCAMDAQSGVDKYLLWEAAWRRFKNSALYHWDLVPEREQTLFVRCAEGEERPAAELLRQRAAKGEHTCLCGLPGSGKTCTAAQLMHGLLCSGERIAVYVDLRETLWPGDGETAARMMERMLFGAADKRRTKELLKLLDGGACPVAMVADNFHTLRKEERRKALRNLKRIAARWNAWLLLLSRSDETEGELSGAKLLPIKEERGLRKLPLFCAAAEEEEAVLLADDFLRAECGNWGREGREALERLLPSLAGELRRRGKDSLSRREVGAWLRRELGPVRFEKTSAADFCDLAIHRLGLLEEKEGGVQFVECVHFTYFAAQHIARCAEKALRENDPRALAAAEGVWGQETDRSWPLLCALEVGERGARSLMQPQHLLERLEAFAGEHREELLRCAPSFTAALRCAKRAWEGEA